MELPLIKRGSVPTNPTLLIRSFVTTAEELAISPKTVALPGIMATILHLEIKSTKSICRLWPSWEKDLPPNLSHPLVEHRVSSLMEVQDSLIGSKVLPEP